MFTFEPVPVPPAPPPTPMVESGLPPAVRFGVPLAIFLVALVGLGAWIDSPPQIIFDEAHYVHWSREIADGRMLRDLNGTDVKIENAPVNHEHPPLAKHLMAWSFQLHGAGQLDLSWTQYEKGCDEAAKLGDPCEAGRAWAGCNRPRDECAREARAWRLPGLLVGASGVAAAYLLGLRLFNSVRAGAFAAGLLLLDNMWYLHSRVALLDVFAASFALWALALALGGGRTNRILAGVAMGAGVASKFPAVYLLPVFVLLLWIRVPFRTPAHRAAWTLLYGLGVPLLAFVAAYLPYLIEWVKIDGVGYAVAQFFIVQGAAVGQDFGFAFDHSSSSPPWAWIPHLNPTFYYWPDHPDYQPPLIYAVGNVAIWWPATAALLAGPVVLFVRWVRTEARLWLKWDVLRSLVWRRFELTPRSRIGLALFIFWAGFAPWFILTRTQFNFYLTLNVPYFGLVAAGLLDLAWPRGRWWRIAVAGYLGLVAAWFALWWPIVSGADVPRAYFDAVWSLVPWMAK